MPPVIREPTLIDRLVYAGYRLVSGVLSRFPGPVIEVAAWVLGGLGASVLRVRRRVVDDNLAHAFPDETPAWRARVARASYRHLVRETLTQSRFTRLGLDAVREITRSEDYAPIRESLEGGNGVILFTGHLGNWEMGGAGAAAHCGDIAAVAIRQRNPLFNRHVVESRNRLGAQIILRDEGPRPMMRLLRENRALALIADQHAGYPGIWTQFFGRPASTARGPAVLAQRTGAPLLVADCVRVPRQPDGAIYRLEFGTVDVEGEGEEWVKAATQACQTHLEGRIRKYPEQYFWHHKRWKWAPESGEVGERPHPPGEPLEEPQGEPPRDTQS